MLEAAKSAARAANGSTEGAILLDSLDVMEAGMQYFFARFQAERAEKKPDWDKADAALLQAVAIAKDITPYCRPRLTAMKIAHDPNSDRSLDNMSREELRRSVMHDLEELQKLGVFDRDQPEIEDQVTSEAAE